MFEKISLNLALNQYKKNDDLLRALKTLIGPTINFYGEENLPLIIETIKNVPVIISNKNEDVYTAARRVTNYPVMGNTYLPTPGIHLELPYIGRTENSFYVEELKRYIFIDGKLDLNSEEGLGILAHELFAHGVTGTRDNISIQGNILMLRSGIRNDFETLNYNGQTGNLEIMAVKTKRESMNEGFIVLIEEEILRQIFPNYSNKRMIYTFQAEIARTLYEKSKFGKIAISEMICPTGKDLGAEYSANSNADWDQLCDSIDSIGRHIDMSRGYLKFKLDLENPSKSTQIEGINQNLRRHLAAEQKSGQR